MKTGDNVSVVNLGTNAVTGTVPVGSEPATLGQFISSVGAPSTGPGSGSPSTTPTPPTAVLVVTGIGMVLVWRKMRSRAA